MYVAAVEALAEVMDFGLGDLNQEALYSITFSAYSVRTANLRAGSTYSAC